MLAIGQTRLGTGGIVALVDDLGMAICRNLFLGKQNLVADRAMLALCPARLRAGWLYPLVDCFRMLQGRDGHLIFANFFLTLFVQEALTTVSADIVSTVSCSRTCSFFSRNRVQCMILRSAVNGCNRQHGIATGIRDALPFFSGSGIINIRNSIAFIERIIANTGYARFYYHRSDSFPVTIPRGICLIGVIGHISGSGHGQSAIFIDNPSQICATAII